MIDLDFGEKLKDISLPTLIVCGEKDKANRKAANDIAQMIPKAEIRIIDNAGHEINTEAPEKLADVLNSF